MCVVCACLCVGCIGNTSRYHAEGVGPQRAGLEFAVQDVIRHLRKVCSILKYIYVQGGVCSGVRVMLPAPTTYLKRWGMRACVGRPIICLNRYLRQ